MAKGTTKGSSGKSKNDPNNRTTVITFGRATAYECEHCDSQCDFGKRYLELESCFGCSCLLSNQE